VLFNELKKKLSDAEINEMIARTTDDPEQKTTDQIKY
jgi:hypothetical protein